MIRGGPTFCLLKKLSTTTKRQTHFMFSLPHVPARPLTWNLTLPGPGRQVSFNMSPFGGMNVAGLEGNFFWRAPRRGHLSQEGISLSRAKNVVTNERSHPSVTRSRPPKNKQLKGLPTPNESYQSLWALIGIGEAPYRKKGFLTPI